MKNFLYHLFIGLLIACAIYTKDYSGVVIVLLLGLYVTKNIPLWPSLIKRKRLPNQEKILHHVMSVKVEKYSPEVIGKLNDNPIHAWIRVKNPENNAIILYEFNDIIQYNAAGNIERAPAKDEVYLSQGLIYKRPA